jgi:hypothetical protein
MSQALPTDEFEFMKEEDFKKLDWTTMTNDQRYGYIVECDLQYPKAYHNSHSSFPLAPESLTIDASRLSPYAQGNSVITKNKIKNKQ